MGRQVITSFICVLPECSQHKGQADHGWFLSYINKHGDLSFIKWNQDDATSPGFCHVCSQECLHILLTRWATGQINSLDRPECASPAVFAGDRLTAWVSCIYKHAANGKSERRIINYKDAGRDCSLNCFRPRQFNLVERTAGHYATFLIEKRGDYTNVVGVLEIDGRPVEMLFPLASTNQPLIKRSVK